MYPDATAYWAYIISRKHKSENLVWKYQGREDERIRRISGDLLYEMITGDPDALEKVYEAIPKAIADLLGEDYELLPYDKKLMEEFREFIYHN